MPTLMEDLTTTLPAAPARSAGSFLKDVVRHFRRADGTSHTRGLAYQVMLVVIPGPDRARRAGEHVAHRGGPQHRAAPRGDALSRPFRQAPHRGRRAGGERRSDRGHRGARRCPDRRDVRGGAGGTQRESTHGTGPRPADREAVPAGVRAGDPGRAAAGGRRPPDRCRRPGRGRARPGRRGPCGLGGRALAPGTALVAAAGIMLLLACGPGPSARVHPAPDGRHRRSRSCSGACSPAC